MATMDLEDTFGDEHALVDPADALGAASLQDEDEIRGALARLLSEPGPQQDQLRRMAYEDVLFEQPLHPSADLSDAVLVDTLTEAVLQGRVALTRKRVVGGGAAASGTVDEMVPQEDADLPCDFEVVIIKCKHMPDADPDGKRKMAGARFWKEDGTDRNDLPAPRSSRAQTRVIEVVAGFEERNADDISIELQGGPGYNCGKSHPHVKVTRGSEVVLDKKGETSLTFKAVAPEPDSVEANDSSLTVLLKRLWSGAGSQNVYTIDIASCGRMPDGSTLHGRRQEKVRVYAKVDYKLSLDIPALGKRSDVRAGGKHLGTGDQRTFRTQERQRGGEHTSNTDIVGRDANGALTRLENQSSYTTMEGNEGLRETSNLVRTADGREHSVALDDVNTDSRLLQAGASVSFTRNGDDLEIGSQIGDIIDSILRIEKTITDVKNFIKDFQPQVGWKFLFDVELFKGNLSLEWGAREWEDHTVYDYWAFNIQMTLFRINAEASFGIEFEVWWVDVVAKIYGSFSVDATIGASKESSPDNAEPWEASVKSSPSGQLGVKAALGADWVKAEGKLSFGITFQAKCKISTEVPFNIDWRVDREKLQATLHGKIRWVGSFDRKWQLVPAKKAWAKGIFPS